MLTNTYLALAVKETEMRFLDAGAMGHKKPLFLAQQFHVYEEYN